MTIIAEFLTSLGFVIDRRSEQAAVESGKRVERETVASDQRRTRALDVGAMARAKASLKEAGVKNASMSQIMARAKEMVAAEEKATASVVRSTNERTKAQQRHHEITTGFLRQISTATTFTAAVQGIEVMSKIAEKAVTVMAQMAGGLERIAYSAKRTGASSAGIRAFGYAAEQLGSDSQEAIGAMEELALKMKQSPGFDQMLKNLGVPSHDENGRVTEFTERMLKLGDVLGKMPSPQRQAYAGALGIPSHLLDAMTSGEMRKKYAEQMDMMAQAGLDPAKADAASKKFMDVWRRMSTAVTIIATKVQGELAVAFGSKVDEFTAYLLKNADPIAKACVDIGKGILEIVKAGVELAKKFSSLDLATREMALKFGALATALILFKTGPIGALLGIAGALALFASNENIEKLQKIWDGFNAITMKLVGQDGLTVAMEALAGVMVLKLLAPLTSVVKLLGALGGMSLPAWLLAVLGVSAAAQVSTAISKGGLPAGVDPITGRAPTDEVGSGTIKSGDEGWGTRWIKGKFGAAKDAIVGAPGDTRSFSERVLPKSLGGKDAPAASTEAVPEGRFGPFKALVQSRESGKASYNSVYGNGKHGWPDKPVTESTVAELLAWQIGRAHV